MAIGEIQSVGLRVRGVVQGVGLRPTVWRIATELRLGGDVRNDAEGVLVRLAGPIARLEDFTRRLTAEAPALARIDRIERVTLRDAVVPGQFVIVPSVPGRMSTAIAPDAATCADCLAELTDPQDRRFRYPFINCTHCGPRLTIVERAPYDRANTSMRDFAMCEACASEYRDPANRRFHAQPIACPRCGPTVTLSVADGQALPDMRGDDAVKTAARLIRDGQIVALKGLGGFHLACDATNADAVARLRARKRRYAKPFAVMMRDLDMVRRYCRLGETAEALLRSREAPIVLLNADVSAKLPEAIAPGLDTVGTMLPYTPLHHLLLRDIAEPVVMTSGNLSEEPQCTDGTEARRRLAGVADYFLDHDRPIVNRVDDFVVRIMAGRPVLLRRARGYAPAPLILPNGFTEAPPVLAMGGELKATFCLIANGQAILSQHLGDVENAPTHDDYQRTLDLFLDLYGHAPLLCAVDLHPEYLTSKLGRQMAADLGMELVEIQHHHAHIASCLAENGVPLDAPPVLGVALDGLGFGGDGTIWGGEFLLADYHGYERAGAFKPVAMLGGARAIREPWRNTYAHLMAGLGWGNASSWEFGKLELFGFLAAKPRAALDQMLKRGLSAPLASSCGRLFDAVAAAVGLCRDAALYEGHGAIMLEAMVDLGACQEADAAGAYPFDIGRRGDAGLLYLEPAPMWRAVLDDLAHMTPTAVIATRFHLGLAEAVARMVTEVFRNREARLAPDTVALSGGCFQNQVLLRETERRLAALGFRVLTHQRVPPNDGGLSLGQAVIAAAHKLRSGRN